MELFDFFRSVSLFSVISFFDFLGLSFFGFTGLSFSDFTGLFSFDFFGIADQTVESFISIVRQDNMI